MTLIRTEDLRKTEVKSFATRYLEKVLTIGKPAKTFSQIGEEFLCWSQFGRSQPLAKTTQGTYKRGIELLEKHFGTTPITAIDKEHVVNLKKDLMDRNCSIGYVHTILCLLRSIMRYCQEDLDLDVLPPHKIKLPPKPRLEIQTLSDPELARVFNEIKATTIQGVRLRAISATFLTSGMRVSELVSLNRNSVDFEDKSAWVIGKGNKKRMVLLTDWAIWWVQQYLNLRKDEHEALFVTHQQGYPIVRLSPDDIRRPLRRIGRKLGVKLTPHTYRRTSGSNLYENAEDLKAVQVHLGHSDIKVTERHYVHTGYRKMKEIHEKHMHYGSNLEDVGTQVVLRWAKEHDQCLNCGTKEIRHAGKGYCYNCYMNTVNAQKRLEKSGENGT